jgi:hypothetical protein
MPDGADVTLYEPTKKQDLVTPPTSPQGSFLQHGSASTQPSTKTTASPAAQVADQNDSVVQTSETFYYALWVLTGILIAVCIQDFYNEYLPHALYRDSAQCSDPEETQKAGPYAYIYCKRHTLVGFFMCLRARKKITTE